MEQMKSLKRGLRAHGVVIAAVCIAVGGTSIAAATQHNAGTAKKKSKRGPPGAVGATGATGVGGAAGVAGVAGSSRAFAKVGYNGVSAIKSPSSLATSKLAGTGLYCINAGVLTPTNSVALADADYSDGSTDGGDTAQVVNGSTANTCPAGQFAVRTFDAAGAAKDIGFTFIVG
jgi:collagen type I alpha